MNYRKMRKRQRNVHRNRGIWSKGYDIRRDYEHYKGNKIFGKIR